MTTSMGSLIGVIVYQVRNGGFDLAATVLSGIAVAFDRNILGAVANTRHVWVAGQQSLK